MSSGQTEERRCPLCDAIMHVMQEEGNYECGRCGSMARFREEQLMAMYIPHYHLRLEELSRRNVELVSLIEMESGRGEARSMTKLRSLHEERQRVLSEYSFLSYFGPFTEKW